MHGSEGSSCCDVKPSLAARQLPNIYRIKQKIAMGISEFVHRRLQSTFFFIVEEFLALFHLDYGYYSQNFRWNVLFSSLCVNKNSYVIQSKEIIKLILGGKRSVMDTTIILKLSSRRVTISTLCYMTYITCM